MPAEGLVEDANMEEGGVTPGTLESFSAAWRRTCLPWDSIVSSSVDRLKSSSLSSSKSGSLLVACSSVEGEMVSEVMMIKGHCKH